MQAEAEYAAPQPLTAVEAPISATRPPAVWPKTLLTAAILLAPVAALGLILSQVVVDGLSWRNMVLATIFYVIIAHGVTVGFHRLFTHRSFEANRPLKILLALVGSMSLEGSIIGWVANHRRHHMFTERDGDPHSPTRPPGQPLGRLRGFWHAHLGWFFDHQSTSPAKYAPDLLADRDIVIIDRLFVPLCVITLVLPFGIGLAITGRFSGGLAAFLWAGLLRVGFFHHVSWSTNSLCHIVGKRPFRTKDASTNVAPLAVLSMGESWHNAHHAFPALARHGVDRHQLDTSAVLIRLFERLGWAKNVRWPDPVRLAARRIARPSELAPADLP